MATEIRGIEELNAKIGKFVAEFPECKSTVMVKLGNKSRKKMVDKGRSMFKEGNPQHKKSLTKLSSMTRKKPFTNGEVTEVDVKAKSPHFHLVNNGHRLVSSLGIVIGYVEPLHYKEEGMEGFDMIAEKEVDAMLLGILRKAGLK